MGFTMSIHVRTREVGRVVQCLKDLHEHDCFVGKSGDGWVGVYSKRCEDSGGIEIPRLALGLSQCVPDQVLAVHVCDDDWAYQLYQAGKLLDQHPVAGLRKLFAPRRRILELCEGSEGRSRTEAVLNSKGPPDPAEEAGLTEEEFIAKTYRDIERVQSMSRDELDVLTRQRKDFYPEWGFRCLDSLCKAVGIVEWNHLYSDLAEEEDDDDSVPRYRRL